MDTFPSALKTFRLARELSQRELGQRIGIDPIMISRYERGKVLPRMRLLRALADALGVSVADLMPSSPSASTPPTPAAA